MCFISWSLPLLWTFQAWSKQQNSGQGCHAKGSEKLTLGRRWKAILSNSTVCSLKSLETFLEVKAKFSNRSQLGDLFILVIIRQLDSWCPDIISPQKYPHRNIPNQNIPTIISPDKNIPSKNIPNKIIPRQKYPQTEISPVQNIPRTKISPGPKYPQAKISPILYDLLVK